MFNKFPSLLILLAFITFLSSCSSKDDVVPVSIEGIWTLSGIDFKADNISAFPASDLGLKDSGYKNAKYNFNADKTYTFLDSSGDMLDDGTYTFDKTTNQLVLSSVYEGEVYKYNYTVSLSTNSLELETIKVYTDKEYDLSDDEVAEISFATYDLFYDQSENTTFQKANDSKYFSLLFKFSK